jgi:hypothetical protein
MIKRILAVSALGSVGLLGLTALPAGATAGPNVNLKMNAVSGALKFSPKTLNLIAGTSMKCNAKHNSFSLTNKTGSNQEIDFGGNPFFNLAAGTESFICQGIGTGTYTVEGSSTASLTVTVSS